MVRVALLLLALSMAMRPAVADVITIDPDNYPNFPATDISSAFAGVTLSTTAGGAVYAANWKTNPDDNVLAGEFSPSFSLNWRLSGNGAPTFRADFHRPTDFVSMLTDPSTGLNYSKLRAFNLAGELIQSISAAHVFATAALSISRPTADIAYILAGSSNDNTTTVLQIFQFNRHEIPEPAALIFFLLGLAGVGFIRLKGQPPSSSPV